MLCAIFYHLYNWRNVKNTHGGVLLLAKLHALACSFTKLALLHGCFPRFLNYTNGTESRKASHLWRNGNILQYGLANSKHEKHFHNTMSLIVQCKYLTFNWFWRLTNDTSRKILVSATKLLYSQITQQFLVWNFTVAVCSMQFSVAQIWVVEAIIELKNWKSEEFCPILCTSF